jgi:arylsulfatase A-like enzyme
MIRRLSFFLVAAVFVTTLCHSAAAAQAPRPNILFILSDDHRPDCIGALGNPHIKTPTLDKLVEQGVSFSRAYVMGSMEGAVCCPSRCMIATGRSLFHLPKANPGKGYAKFAAAMKDKTEGRDWSLLPRTLRAAGYATFHIGKRGNECVPALESYDLDVTHNDTSPRSAPAPARCMPTA